MEKSKLSRSAGTFIILAIGLIHLANSAHEFHDAFYMGVLFVVLFLLSLISALGIHRGHLLWGWWLGACICLGAIAGYLTSRTVGFPFAGRQDWGPLLAFYSIFLEVCFLTLTVKLIQPYFRCEAC